jgi:uncharacterized repeat protein (TIGR02543 family)
MKSYAKKIMTRLAAGAMALLLAVGTAATDMSVYAAETKTQESMAEKRKITGFADLADNPKEIRMTGKISLERLLAKMPQSIDVYLDGGKDATSIPVTWHCVGDYDNTNYFVYEFDPGWDTEQYSLGAGLKRKIPYINVIISGTGLYKGAGISQSEKKSNEKKVYNFAKKKLKLNTAAACGVLSNIESESSFNPTASVIDTNGKISYGICQWNASRFDDLKNYCSSNGYDYTSIEGQLKFLKYELEHSESSAFSKIKNVENTADGAYTAGYNWARYFERCASVYFEGRAKRARDVYWAKYSSDSPDDPDDPDNPDNPVNKKYTIKYVLYDGENNSANPSSYKVTTETITLKKPTKKGYTFEGWYKESSFKNQITTIPKGSKGNLTLYAKWKANKYTIRFHGNKATSGSVKEMKNLEYDMDYTLNSNKFKRKGYKFVRWSTKADGSGRKYGNREEIENLSSKNGAVVDLYALWSRDTYKITYKANGGELADGTVKKYNVDTKTFKLKTPVRYGYTFKGWYKDKKCTRRVTQVKKGTIGNLTFYAKWQINKYKIKYNGNGATGGSMKNVTVCKYGSTYTLAKNKYKRTGYVFEGWNTKKNGKGDFYEDGEDIRNITAKNGKTITLYAQWSKKAYSIKYVSGGGTVPSGNPTSYYYDTPTFKLAAATKEGYTFQGWYTDSAYKNRITKITKGTRKNYKLYAKWKINTYDIVFDGNGATAGTMRSISSCKYNTTYKLPANTFQKNGYQFIGWSTRPDGSETFYGDEASVSNLSLTDGAKVKLYAQWEAL